MTGRSAARDRLTAVHAREIAGLSGLGAELDAHLSLKSADFGGIHRAARNPIFSRYPLSLQIRLKGTYLETAGPKCRTLFGDERWRAVAEGRGTDSLFQADIDLAAVDAVLRHAFVDFAFDDSELQQRAVKHADACAGISFRNPLDRAFELACGYANRHAVSPPVPPARNTTLKGCINRLRTPRWWRRTMRRTYGRQAEEALRQLGFVHKSASLYVSPEALQSRIERRLATLRLLDEVTATNDLGQTFTLSELAACSTSNAFIRRSELMVRVRGMETHAAEHGDAAHFYIVTTPSRFHCRDRDGTNNPRYQGATVRHGQQWLNRQWQRLRSSLQRKGIVFYGLRTVEPHHDGTPHWNVLMFAPRADAAAIALEFERYFLLSDSPREPGARAHRVRRIEIDPAKGDATSYIAKYISKSIDGFGVGVDHEDTDRQRDAVETCVRVEAWASIHGIRQFQFFGGPPVTVWRELRRLRRGSLGVIEEARQAAEAPSWSSYIRVQGGVQHTTNRSVRLHKTHSDTAGLYGDPIGARIVGVESDDLVEVTRDREWTINWPGTDPPRSSFSFSESCQ